MVLSLLVIQHLIFILRRGWEARIYPALSSQRDIGVGVSIYTVITEALEWFEVTA